MDRTFWLLMVAACVCGSYRNSSQLPEPYTENLARSVGNERNERAYSVPHYVHQYKEIISAKDVKGLDREDHADPEKTKENECPLCHEKFQQAFREVSSHMANPEALVRLKSMMKMYDLLTEEQKRYIDQENDVSSHQSEDGLELDINLTPNPDDDISLLAIMNVTPLRYSDELHKIDWSNIFDQALPHISNHRRNVLGHLTGQFSINPLLIVGKIIQDQQRGINYNMSSDEEFRASFKFFANTLSRSEQDFDAMEKGTDISPLKYVLRKTIGNNDDLIRSFLSICDAISKRYNIPTTTSHTNKINPRDIIKRTNDDEISLQLPFTHSECWQLGGSHYGAQETQSSATDNGKMSAIDMSPYLFSKWGVPFDFVHSFGEVFSSHSGFIKKHSDCSIEVRHDTSNYSTYYSHIKPNDIEDGIFVESGESIGRISIDPDLSNCKCDWSSSSFLCATGPHLHFELRFNGAPVSLDGRMISNLRIKTGLLPHDSYCTDPQDCTRATFLGKSCATYFTHQRTGEVTCAVTKQETNIGGGYSYGVAHGTPGNLGAALLAASYLCTNYECKKDASHTENVDWGYYNNAFGTKHECQAKCLNNQDCEVHEWSDAEQTCKWWKKGVCQYEKDNISADPKFVSCKKLEYDFKKFDHNTICLPREEEEFPELEEAKTACKDRRNCKGVLQPDCTHQSKYYLCTDTAKLVTNLYFNEPSCFYQKYIIARKPIPTSTTSMSASPTTSPKPLAATTTTMSTSSQVNGGWGEWTEWNACPVSCGGADQRRTRSCDSPAPQFGGDDCSVGGSSASETQQCNDNPCPVWKPWMPWGRCSRSCTLGHQQRRRNCNSATPEHGERPCETDGTKSLDTRVCNKRPCCLDTYPKNYVHAQCQAACLKMRNQGHCRRTWNQVLRGACRNRIPQWHRNRRINLYCRKTCGACANPPTNQWDTFGSYSSCNTSCGPGMKSRSRACKGHLCLGNHIQKEECNLGPCQQVDCVWNDWSAWTSCSKLCGGGQQSHTRTIKVAAQGGGKECNGPEIETKVCNTQECLGVDCVWNDWDDWSSCSKLCGGGQQSRTRTIKVAAQGGGKECIGPKISTKVCNAQVCIDGKWGNWGPWNFNRCVSSQGCKKTSLRKCNNPIPSPGGKQCVGIAIRAADCVTDRYPTGLSQTCRRQFSCVLLKRQNRCNRQYKNAMNPGCKRHITNWWQNQRVKNHCKKACLNCARPPRGLKRQMANVIHEDSISMDGNAEINAYGTMEIEDPYELQNYLPRATPTVTARTSYYNRVATNDEEPQINCNPKGNPRCNPNTWDRYDGYTNGCCSKQEPCFINEGDCNFHEDCLGSLVCTPNSCPSSTDKSKAFNERAACCQQPSGEYIYEYDFEKQLNTKCDPFGEAFNTLDDAQNACKSSKHCQGITNDTSSDQKNYHICPANATITLGIDIKTSFYKKIIIDPCDAIKCNGTNAICKVVFSTGKPFCSCPPGFRGDPNVKCGGSDFQKGEGFYCNSHYHNESSLLMALSQCRLDVNCSMVGAPKCNNQTSDSLYYLCGKNPELTQIDDGCYYRKIVLHCTDGLKNGDETGLDCGGSCDPCKVSVQIKLQAIEETSGISWRITNTECKSDTSLQLSGNRVYLKDCELSLGQSYTLQCENEGNTGYPNYNGWWKANFLVIENSVYCEYSNGEKTINIKISGAAPEQCPVDFPKAFNYGKSCCHYDKDKEDNIISSHSQTCKYDAYRPCQKDHCIDNTDDKSCSVQGEVYNPATKSCECGSTDSCTGLVQCLSACPEGTTRWEFPETGGSDVPTNPFLQLKYDNTCIDNSENSSHCYLCGYRGDFATENCAEFRSGVDYYSANSANYCDPGNGACKCSVTNEQCTGLEICSKDGSCEALELIIEATCDNTFDSDGYIMSPNYPQQYENGLDCRWTITAPVGNIIALTIYEFHTESNGGDKLYIYHGTNIHGASVRTLSKSESMPFSSTGDSLYLKFSTHNSVAEKGFKIKADAVVPCTGDGGSSGDGQSQGSCKNGLFCMESGLCLACTGDGGKTGDFQSRGSCDVGKVCSPYGNCTEPYEKITDRWCSPSYGSYASALSAKSACTSDPNCQGVLDRKCDDSGRSSLFSKSAVFYDYSGDCIYTKGLEGPCFWRQSGGCRWDGPREESNDKGCCYIIADGWSGYCECANGTITMKKGCEEGASSSCKEACQDEVQCG